MGTFPESDSDKPLYKTAIALSFSIPDIGNPRSDDFEQP